MQQKPVTSHPNQAGCTRFRSVSEIVLHFLLIFLWNVTVNWFFFKFTSFIVLFILLLCNAVRRSMDQGSMFCTFPKQSASICIFSLLKPHTLLWITRCQCVGPVNNMLLALCYLVPILGIEPEKTFMLGKPIFIWYWIIFPLYIEMNIHTTLWQTTPAFKNPW